MSKLPKRLASFSFVGGAIALSLVSTTHCYAASLKVNGFKGRGISKPITIQSTQSKSQACQISAFTKINGEVTQLLQVHIDLTRRGLFGLGGTVHNITFYGAGQKQEKIVCESNCSF
ncbi:MAG: hypothetical protein KME21_12650 [Desmonostoc vinosum HA7617-LM4]|jgi:hypothetical protein|nr:hypothetical protein [Desmonostoc vinosum HA7617-LM4]